MLIFRASSVCQDAHTCRLMQTWTLWRFFFLVNAPEIPWLAARGSGYLGRRSVTVTHVIWLLLAFAPSSSIMCGISFAASSKKENCISLR